MYSSYKESSDSLDKPYIVELDKHGIKKGELERVRSQPEYKKYLKSIKNPKDKELFKKLTIHNLKIEQELIQDFESEEDAMKWDHRLDRILSCTMDHFKGDSRNLIKYQHTYEEHLRGLKSSRWFAFKTSKLKNYTKEECYEYFK
tara:strand:+ start:37714 stop:38148 length:435 start_codon:yes stop_codon:yes gene_type:complete